MKKFATSLVLSLVIAVSAGLLVSGQASAWNGSPDEIPDSTVSGNWSNIYLEISKPGGSNNTLDAPEVYAKLSYDNIGDPAGAGANHFRIYDFCMSDASGVDYGVATGYASGDCFNGGANVINAQVCAMDANENITGNCQTISSCPYGCFAPNDWTGYIPINLGGLTRSSKNGKYNYSIRITFANWFVVPGGNLNAFRVEASWGIAGFMAQGSYPIAVQNRNKTQNFSGTGWEDNMNFAFKIPCSYGSNSFMLRWFDSDSNTFDGNIAWTITNSRTGQQFSSEQAAFFSGMGNAQFMGGNGIDSSTNIVNSALFGFAPGDQIVWTWRNVQANNGVTMYMPFDDAKTQQLPCSTPPSGGLITSACDLGKFQYRDRSGTNGEVNAAILGWAQDPDYPVGRVHVYVDAPAGSPGSKFAGEFYADKYAVNGQVFSNGYTVNNPTPFGTGVPSWHDWFAIPTSVLSPYLSDSAQHTVYVYNLGLNAAGVQDHQNIQYSTTIGPCAQPKCAGATLTISTPEPNQSFNFTVKINAPGVSGGSGFYAIRRADDAASPLAPGTNVSNGTTSSAYNSDNELAVNNVTVSEPGVFYLRWTFNGGGGSVICSTPLTIVVKPYMRVYGNDIVAGGNFASADGTCAASTEGTLLAFVRNDSGANYRGAGVQYAAYAADYIQRFYSAAQSSSGATPPVDLTFGNFNGSSKVTPTDAVQNTMGGRGGVVGCAQNYFENRQSGLPTSPAANISLAGTTGIYVNPNNAQGTLRFSNSAGITGAKAVYVDGDLIIDNNITYGAYGSVSTIPSLYVVVKGNIYIRGNVSELAGIYIAQDNGTGSKGKIYTCADTTGAIARLYNADELYNNCSGKLTVRGTFIGEQIKFLRTNGTLNNAAALEASTAPHIAEVFDFNPETYLATNPYIRTDTPLNKADAIVGLPPIL